MAAVNVLGDRMNAPRMPAELVVASVAYFAAGAVLLAGRVVAFMTPDPYSGARFAAPQAYPDWVVWVVPLALMVFAVMVRGGGNGVRVTLTVLAVVLGLASFGLVMDSGGDGAGLVSGVLLLALFAVAVVLHYLPRSNAYVREVRRR